MANALQVCTPSRIRGAEGDYIPVIPTVTTGNGVARGVGAREFRPPIPRKGVRSAPLSGVTWSEPISAASDLRLQASRNIGVVLKGKDRDEIARLVADRLKRPFSRRRLDKIASSDPRGQLTVPEAVALCGITKSLQPVQGALDELGLVAVAPEVAKAGQLALDLGKIIREFGEVA